MVESSRVRLVVIAAVTAVAAAAVTTVLLGRRGPELVLHVEPSQPQGEMTVYIGGAVATPGLYTIAEHTRVADAVGLAQPLAEADLDAVPMAAVLHDGQQVVVPSRADEASPVPARTAKATPVPKPSGPININIATADQLDGLPGIGPVLAQRIIEYRNAHGPFTSIDQLAAVQGISTRMVDDLRDHLTLGP